LLPCELDSCLDVGQYASESLWWITTKEQLHFLPLYQITHTDQSIGATERDLADRELTDSVEFRPFSDYVIRDVAPVWSQLHRSADRTLNFAVLRITALNPGSAIDSLEVLVVSGPSKEFFKELTFNDQSDLRKERGDLLRNAEMLRKASNQKQDKNQVNEEAYCSVSGTQLHGLETQTSEGRVEADQWRSCTEDFNKQVRDRLERVFKTIGMQHGLAATVLKEAVKFRDGHWSFSDSVRWMTSLGEIPYDAKMTLNGKEWEIDIPDSSAPLVVPDSAGMQVIARILMYNNIACPSGWANLRLLWPATWAQAAESVAAASPGLQESLDSQDA
jgi:hypothetical protein